jgi:hypothetical protein
MEYLFENPVPLVMAGLVLLTFTGVLFYTTRSTPAMVAMALIAALTVSLLVMEQLVQTPREGVVITLRAAAAASESNDMDRVLSFVANDATEARALITSLMPKFEITTANVGRDIEITFDDDRNPQRATARFEPRFYGRHKRSGAVAAPRSVVEVDLVLEKSVWAIERIEPEGPWREELNSLR